MFTRLATLFLACSAFVLYGAGNLLINPSLEDDLTGWEVPGWMKNRIKPQPDKTVFISGQASLRISGEPEKTAYLRQWVALPPGTKELTYSGRIKTVGLTRGWSANIHLECYDAKKKMLKQFIKGTSWQKPENDWETYGEAVSLPEGTIGVYMVLRMYHASSWTGKPDNTGNAWFDDLAIYAGKLPQVFPAKQNGTDSQTVISVEPVKTGGVFLPGEPVTMKCVLNTPAEASYSVIDFFAKKVFEGKASDTGIFTFTAPEKNGYYAVKVQLEGGKYGEKSGSFVVVEKTPSPDPFFSMCHHYMWDEYLPAVRMLGYGSMTVSMYSYDVQKQLGVYDFSTVDKRIALIEKLGMKPHGFFSIPGNSNWSDAPWLAQQRKDMLENGYSEQYYLQVGNFVRACVQHLGHHVSTWSHSGEINLSRRHSKYIEPHYLRCQQIIYSEVKAYDPKLPVVALGVAGTDYPNYTYLKYILPKALPYLDVVGPDWYNTPYVYGPGYRPASEESCAFREQILDLQKMTMGKQLTIEEKGYGYASGMPFDHPALADNAAVAQRGMIIAKALGIMRWIPHYGIAKREGKTYNMGMWSRNNPRPILASTATIARLLAHAHDALEVHPLPEVWGYVFQRGNMNIAALWQSSRKPVIATSLKLPEDAVCYDIMGNRCAFEGKLFNYPIFVESNEQQTRFADRVRESTFQLPEYAVESQFVSTSEIRLAVRNLSGKELTLQVSHPDAQPQQIQLKSSDNLCSAGFKLQKAAVSPYHSAFTIVCKGEKRSFPANLECTPIRKLENVKLDGTLQSFAEVVPLVMENQLHLLPVDAAPNGLWLGKDDLSAKVYLGYDEDNFYIGTDVTDDQWFFTQSGSMLWNQDAIEISVDPLNNALSQVMKPLGYDADDLDFSYGNSAKGSAAWCHVHPDQRKRGDRPDLCPMVLKSETGTMVIEFAIPWGELGIKPEKGLIFGFNLAVFDRDDQAGTVPYNMSLSPGTTTGKDPSCYQKFVLSGGE